MNFKKIDINNWKRKEYFEHYFSNVPCTYSMSIKLDISNIIKNKMKLYPSMIYCISTIVNQHEEFRININPKGEIVLYDVLFPCYTIFHKNDETFSNIWTKYHTDYNDFLNEYEKDQIMFINNKGINAKPNTPENTFPISMIPWTSFDGFNLNLKNDYDYLLPIFTMGKYYHENDKIILPLSIQVHHAVCDGFHTCRFLNELQEKINQLQ